MNKKKIFQRNNYDNDTYSIDVIINIKFDTLQHFYKQFISQPNKTKPICYIHTLLKCSYNYNCQI